MRRLVTTLDEIGRVLTAIANELRRLRILAEHEILGGDAEEGFYDGRGDR